jgi:hypothetical protein
MHHVAIGKDHIVVFKCSTSGIVDQDGGCKMIREKNDCANILSPNLSEIVGPKKLGFIFKGVDGWGEVGNR